VKRRKQKPLDPDAIVQAGLEMLRKKGLASVSFRNLAKRLGVTPMALYRHFDDKQALLAAMLDAFIAQADVLPATHENWQRWLVHVSEHMYQALVRHPSWIPLLGEIPLRQAGLKVMNECLDTLIRAGFTRQEAVEGFLGMIHILLGAALMSCQLNKHASHHGVNAAMSDIHHSYPRIAESLEPLQQLSDQTLMQPAMALLIAGMQQKLDSRG